MFARAMQSRKCPSRGALALVRRFEISLLNYLEDCSVFEAIQVDDFWACVVFLVLLRSCAEKVHGVACVEQFYALFRIQVQPRLFVRIPLASQLSLQQHGQDIRSVFDVCAGPDCWES